MMNNTLPDIRKLFPYEYVGGGYFRKRNVPIGQKAKVLHGEQAVQYLYNNIKRVLKEE